MALTPLAILGALPLVRNPGKLCQCLKERELFLKKRLPHLGQHSGAMTLSTIVLSAILISVVLVTSIDI